jgi:hypothetical protein
VGSKHLSTSTFKILALLGKEQRREVEKYGKEIKKRKSKRD